MKVVHVLDVHLPTIDLAGMSVVCYRDVLCAEFRYRWGIRVETVVFEPLDAHSEESCAHEATRIVQTRGPKTTLVFITDCSNAIEHAMRQLEDVQFRDGRHLQVAQEEAWQVLCTEFEAAGDEADADPRLCCVVLLMVVGGMVCLFGIFTVTFYLLYEYA